MCTCGSYYVLILKLQHQSYIQEILLIICVNCPAKAIMSIGDEITQKNHQQAGYLQIIY